MPPGSIGGMGSFSFGGPVQDTRAGSGSGSGFSFGQTEAAPGTAAHVPPASPAPSAPTAPPAPPALPGPPARPAMPVMPSTQLSSPDIPKVPELPAIPKISAPFMVPSPPASIPSDTLPIVVPDAASRPSSCFMAATSDSRPVLPSGIQPSESSLTAHDITTATYKRTERGIESEDYVLNDPFQLYRFFVAHNDKPQMHVLITGSHVEKKSVEKRNGDGSVSNVHNRVKVRDFKIDLDLTSYISPYGTIKTLPDPKTSTKLSLREVIEQHVSEENPFKEMHMKKKVSWDYEDLTRAIVHAIRSVNYRYKIEISYPTSNNRVIVHSAAPLAQFMRSTWTKTFCGLSLVDIVFYPLREYYKIVKDKNIQSEFHMTISTADFMRNSYWKIVDQVQFKNE
ncbi:hypothetical protein BGX23_003380 [Mortierella sp. AD031]|nr:hypothetical protein BGX23_003380 [Mortierella sp. AD031]